MSGRLRGFVDADDVETPRVVQEQLQAKTEEAAELEAMLKHEITLGLLQVKEADELREKLERAEAELEASRGNEESLLRRVNQVERGGRGATPKGKAGQSIKALEEQLAQRDAEITRYKKLQAQANEQVQKFKSAARAQKKKVEELEAERGREKDLVSKAAGELQELRTRHDKDIQKIRELKLQNDRCKKQVAGLQSRLEAREGDTRAADLERKLKEQEVSMHKQEREREKAKKALSQQKRREDLRGKTQYLRHAKKSAFRAWHGLCTRSLRQMAILDRMHGKKKSQSKASTFLRWKVNVQASKQETQKRTAYLAPEITHENIEAEIEKVAEETHRELEKMEFTLQEPLQVRGTFKFAHHFSKAGEAGTHTRDDYTQKLKRHVAKKLKLSSAERIVVTDICPSSERGQPCVQVAIEVKEKPSTPSGGAGQPRERSAETAVELLAEQVNSGRFGDFQGGPVLGFTVESHDTAVAGGGGDGGGDEPVEEGMPPSFSHCAGRWKAGNTDEVDFNDHFVLFQDPASGVVEGINEGGDDEFTMEGTVSGRSLELHQHYDGEDNTVWHGKIIDAHNITGRWQSKDDGNSPGRGGAFHAVRQGPPLELTLTVVTGDVGSAKGLIATAVSGPKAQKLRGYLRQMMVEHAEGFHGARGGQLSRRLADVAETLTVEDAKLGGGDSPNRYGRLEPMVELTLGFHPPSLEAARAFGQTVVRSLPSLVSRGELRLPRALSKDMEPRSVQVIFDISQQFEPPTGVLDPSSLAGGLLDPTPQVEDPARAVAAMQQPQSPGWSVGGSIAPQPQSPGEGWTSAVKTKASQGYAALAHSVGELAGGGIKPFNTYTPVARKPADPNRDPNLPHRAGSPPARGVRRTGGSPARHGQSPSRHDATRSPPPGLGELTRYNQQVYAEDSYQNTSSVMTSRASLNASARMRGERDPSPFPRDVRKTQHTPALQAQKQKERVFSLKVKGHSSLGEEYDKLHLRLLCDRSLVDFGVHQLQTAWIRTGSRDGTGSPAKAEQFVREHQGQPEQFWDIPADARWYVDRPTVAGRAVLVEHPVSEILRIDRGCFNGTYEYREDNPRNGFPTYQNEYGKFLYHTSDGRWNFSSALEPAPNPREYAKNSAHGKPPKPRGVAHLRMHGKAGEVPTGERLWQSKPPPIAGQANPGKTVTLSVTEEVDKPGFHDHPHQISGHKLNFLDGDPTKKEYLGRCILEYNEDHGKTSPGPNDDPVRHATGAVQLANFLTQPMPAARAAAAAAAAAAALEPSELRYHAFEVKVLSTGANGMAEVGVGLAFDFDEGDGEHHGDVESQPGWNHGSVGYHCDNGKLYEGSDDGHVTGPICKEGDVIRCGIASQERSYENENEVHCWFTVNGFHVGTATLTHPSGSVWQVPNDEYDSLLKKIYPTIALSGLGEKVQVLVKKDAPNPLAEAEKTLAKTAPLRIQYSESPYSATEDPADTRYTPEPFFGRHMLFSITRGQGRRALYSVSALAEPRDPRSRGVVVSEEADGGTHSLSEGYVLRRVNGIDIDTLVQQEGQDTHGTAFDASKEGGKLLLPLLCSALERQDHEQGELILEFKDRFEVALEADVGGRDYEDAVSDDGHGHPHSFKREGLTVPYDEYEEHEQHFMEATAYQHMTRYLDEQTNASAKTTSNAARHMANTFSRDS